MALLIAAMSADGTSIIHNNEQMTEVTKKLTSDLMSVLK
jgi:hypothetical protein